MWRETGRKARFFYLEAWIVVVWMFALFPVGFKKVVIASILTVLLTILRVFRMNTSNGLRLLRSFAAGPIRGAVSRRRKRRLS